MTRGLGRGFDNSRTDCLAGGKGATAATLRSFHQLYGRIDGRIAHWLQAICGILARERESSQVAQSNGPFEATARTPDAGGEHTMLKRSEIEEHVLTLEDVALLADPDGQLPKGTLNRLRPLVRTDPRVNLHFAYLESLADAARMPETSDRLHRGLRYLEEVERLEAAGDWQHPGEVLDPTGEIGISYPELIQLAGMLARQEGERGRYHSVERRLEGAWSKEKAGDELAERFAARLCDYQPAEAERLLRQAARHYQARRQQAAEPREAVG